jgi:branched-chain amino acid transport system substrate-binding protein
MVSTAFGLGRSVRICFGKCVRLFSRIVFQKKGEVFMKRNRQNTVLDRCAEDVRQSSKHVISRRKFVQTSAGVIAAGALLGKRAFAAPGPLKIGYVSPETGPLAPFGEADAFVVDQLRKKFQGGIMAGGATRSIEVLVRDSQSSPNRCAEVAASLIKTDKIDMMLVSNTPDTVNPVADQCEVNQVPCISTIAPAEPYFFGRGGKPDKGFDWTYHFFFDVPGIATILGDIFLKSPTNKTIGLLLGDDNEGNFFADKKMGFPPPWEARGLSCFDPGRFQLNTNDFSAQIAAFKKNNAECLFANMPLPPASTFLSQAHQQGYLPKTIVVGRATLFPSAIETLGVLGKGLSIEIWWSPAHPFKSSLTGQSSKQVCDGFEEVTKKQWTQVIGFNHALFEIAADAFKRAQNPDSNASLIEAVRSTRLNTLVGPIQWQGPPPNKYVTIPLKNVCTTPLVSGQWVPGKKWMYDLVVTDNQRYPEIPVQAKPMYYQS